MRTSQGAIHMITINAIRIAVLVDPEKRTFSHSYNGSKRSGNADNLKVNAVMANNRQINLYIRLSFSCASIHSVSVTQTSKLAGISVPGDEISDAQIWKATGRKKILSRLLNRNEVCVKSAKPDKK